MSSERGIVSTLILDDVLAMTSRCYLEVGVSVFTIVACSDPSVMFFLTAAWVHLMFVDGVDVVLARYVSVIRLA
jgi:hypothetical protein